MPVSVVDQGRQALMTGAFMGDFFSMIRWLGVLLIVVSIVYYVIEIAYRVVEHRRRHAWGFRDVVKNPDFWRGVRQSRMELDAAIEASRSWDDAHVAELTRWFILEATSRQDAWGEYRILRELGDRTHPTLLSILRDPSLHNRLVTPTGKFFVPEAPFNRACDLFGESPPHQAIEVLAAYLNDPSPGIRQHAVMTIAKTGVPAITPHVRAGLSDQDEGVRSYAMMGLAYALSRSAMSATVRAELFPDVLKLLRAGQNEDRAVEILHHLDAARANEFFLSPEMFSAESPIIHQVLKVLADGEVSVPREGLLPLIETFRQQERKYPKTYALGAALRLLGQQRRSEDRALLQALMMDSDERVAEGAAAGLLGSYGLTGFELRVSSIEREAGYGSLTPPQRHYSAVRMCDSEIRNGGLSQYFVNSSGDHWRDALEGFAAMGFRERLAVLQEATRKFGEAGPSAERDARQRQLSKLFRRNDKLFEPLESRYFQCREVLGAQVAYYVIEHAAHFR